jgi:hypothetical protein
MRAAVAMVHAFCPAQRETAHLSPAILAAPSFLIAIEGL